MGRDVEDRLRARAAGDVEQVIRELLDWSRNSRDVRANGWDSTNIVQAAAEIAAARWHTRPPAFELRIEMGNAAMLDVEDVSIALREVAHKLYAADGTTAAGILDLNGNTVGEWELVLPPPPDDEGDGDDGER